MSKDPYFTRYNSPNIVIVPTKTLCVDPPQKPEPKADSKPSAKDTNKSIPILIQGTSSNSETCTDMNPNARNKSWASNYSQSIGLSCEKSVVDRRVTMNTNQDNGMFLTQDPPPAVVGPHQFIDVNLQAPNIINYQNTGFPNYNNTTTTTGVTPVASYPGSYENNNYYYGQPMNVVKNGCCSTYYGSVENPQNMYLSPYGEPLNVGNNTRSTVTYYSPDATLAPSANLPPYQEFYSFPNPGQQVNITDNSKITSSTPCEDNRCPTPLIDENLLTPQLSTCVNATLSVTKLADVKSCNIAKSKLSPVSKENKCECDCMCSKRNFEIHDKQNTEIEITTNKKIEEISSVQANEKAFRDFLRKLKIDRSSKPEKKPTSSSSKSSANSKKGKKSKIKAKEKSSVQENEKAFRKLLQKLKMDHISESDISQNKQIIKINTSLKDKTSKNEQYSTSLEKRSSKDSKLKEKPKFIKTKYVDEQEPEYIPIKKTRLDSNYELEKYSKTKSTTTKYFDQLEHDYKPIKKSGIDGHEIKKYLATKSKCTKYIDKKEPERKPVKRNESDYELKKYSNTKTLSTKYVNDVKHEYKQNKKTKIDRGTEFSNIKMKRSIDESDKSSKKYDTDYKIKTYKTESTTYYKYRNEDCEDTHKHSTPVKSVVKISKTRELKKSPPYNILDKNDLRDKLSRKLPTKNKESKEEIFKRKSSEKSKDNNLVITVNNNISENKMSPVKITDKLRTKTESSKKINLVINIVYKQPGTRSESDKSDSDSHSPQENTDLSFLDDFNVDEIVASLNKTEKIITSQTDASNATTLGEETTKKTDPSNILIKREKSEFEAQMILEKGDKLNSLLSKEACILDSFRIIHEEYEKRSHLDNEQNKSFSEPQNKLPLQDNYVVDDQLKKDIKKETVVHQSNYENKSPEKSVISKLEDSEKGVIKVIQEQTQNSTDLTARISDIDSNNMHTYDYDVISFDEKDKLEQLELLKILQDTKDGEIEAIQTQSTSTPQTVQVSDIVAIIDLISDDSNDSYKIKDSKEKNIDDVYIVEEKSKDYIEAIDLTTTEELSRQILTPLKTTEVLINKDKITVSSNNVKENILVDEHNMRVTERDMLLNENNVSDKNVLVKQAKVQAKDVCLDNSQLSKDTGTDKDISTIKVTIDYLKTNETLNRTGDKLNEDAIIEFPAMTTIKETLDIPSDLKDRASNIEDEINESQGEFQPSDKNISISMEYENSIARMINKDSKQIQKVENCISIKNSGTTASDGAEDGKHENKKGHIKFKEEVTITKVPNNDKIEETLLLQAKVDAKNEKCSSTNKKIVNDVTKNTIQTKSDAIEIIPEIDICNKQEENAEEDKKTFPQITELKTELHIDEKKNMNENGKSPKGKVQNKTEASSPMPSISGTKVNNPSPPIKKDRSNLNIVEMNKKMKNVQTVSKVQQIPKLAGKIEHEMFNCFKQKYTAQGIIHSGTFSKVFHFTSFSGRDYAVKSYNDWQSIYKYAEKKDMLISLQNGLMRNAYGCVYLINTFSLQGHLCLLMDYYPKNLKQALGENGMPFHINAVQYLARQLVSAVMLLKSHDVVHLGHLCLLMDYYPKNLKQALEENGMPFHINAVQYLARQLVSAMMLLKSHDLVHLDIKPTHILLSHSNDRLKLCGFDSARYINKIPMLPNLGTPNYRPPEVILGYKVGFDVDVWATGLVMYEMATDLKLFPGMQNNDILFKQMCTLGPLPVEMLHRSHFSATHFTGSSFKRVMVNKQNKINIITKFYKTKRLETTIIKAYNRNWRPVATQEGLMADKKKILSFTALLREMLEVNPGDRMPIQFVNTHAFITDGY